MYESHVTVSGIEADEFLYICNKISVKPILIEMDSGSGYEPQMMTGKFHKTDNVHGAKREMDFIASHFSNILRKKLELILGKNSIIPDHLYLEFHSKFEVLETDVDAFVKSVSDLGGHTSRNAYKKHSDARTAYYFATSRDLTCMEIIIQELSPRYPVVNTIRECVLYDDNPDLDINWHGCHDCLIKSFEV